MEDEIMSFGTCTLCGRAIDNEIVIDKQKYCTPCAEIVEAESVSCDGIFNNPPGVGDERDSTFDTGFNPSPAT